MKCAGNFKLSTKIETRSLENGVFWKKKHQEKDRGQNDSRLFAQNEPVDRLSNREKSKKCRAIAGRSPKTSRSIARLKDYPSTFWGGCLRASEERAPVSKDAQLPIGAVVHPKPKNDLPVRFRKRCHFYVNSNQFWFQKLGQIMGNYKYQAS